MFGEADVAHRRRARLDRADEGVAVERVPDVDAASLRELQRARVLRQRLELAALVRVQVDASVAVRGCGVDEREGFRGPRLCGELGREPPPTKCGRKRSTRISPPADPTPMPSLSSTGMDSSAGMKTYLNRCSVSAMDRIRRRCVSPGPGSSEPREGFGGRLTLTTTAAAPAPLAGTQIGFRLGRKWNVWRVTTTRAGTLSARCQGWSAGSRMWPRCVPSFPLPARVNGARAGPDAKLDTARPSEETSTSAGLRRSPANSLPSSTDRAWAALPRSSAASLSTATGSTPTRSTTVARRCDPRRDLLTLGVPIRERHPRPFYPDRRET